MERINQSYLFLLRECPGAIEVWDFQLMLLSNSIYLIIAKVLANQLREVIGDRSILSLGW